MSKIDPMTTNEFKQAADEKIESMRQTLKEKGMDEEDINWFIDTMNQAVNNTIKQKENE